MKLSVAPFLLALGACTANKALVPFSQEGGWTAFASSGARTTGDRYIQGYGAHGIELVTPAPGTSGWGWEVGGRNGDVTGYDTELQVFRFFFQPAVPGNPTIVSDQSKEFPSKREIELWELNVGVRQTFWDDARLRPYFGVGGSLFRIRTEQTLSGTLHVVPPPEAANQTEFDVLPRDPHSIDWDYSFGLYLRGGFLWRIFGQPEGHGLGTFLSTDVRYQYGHELQYIELNVGIGLGR
jgi:hypothetical protein